MKDIIIKKSSIGQFKNGFGLFTARDFKKGEIVKIFLYPIPERYVNHSDNPNTIQNFEKGYDIALRDIKSGEEITTDSTKEDF